MRAYEFPAQVNAEGKIELPDTLLHQLQQNQQLKVIIMVNEPSQDEVSNEAWLSLAVESIKGDQDDVPLIGKQATRQGILQAFNEHLIKQAKPGDVVVSAAVTRLQPQLKSLLAGRVVRYILGNAGTSRVNINVKMIVADSKKVLGQAFTARGIGKNVGASQPNKPVTLSDLGIPKLPVGMKVAFQIQNNETVPLYVSILSIDSSGKMDVIFPFDWSSASGDALIQPGKQVLIPESGANNSTLKVSEPQGFSEALIIASTSPLRDSLRVLQTLAAKAGVVGKRSFIPGVTGDEFLNLTNSLIDDLDRTTRGPSTGSTLLPADVRGIDVNKVATMSIPFEVTKSV